MHAKFWSEISSNFRVTKRQSYYIQTRLLHITQFWKNGKTAPRIRLTYDAPNLIGLNGQLPASVGRTLGHNQQHCNSRLTDEINLGTTSLIFLRPYMFMLGRDRGGDFRKKKLDFFKGGHKITTYKYYNLTQIRGGSFTQAPPP